MSSFECNGQKVEVSLIRTLMKVTVFCFWGEQHRAISEIIKPYNGGKA